MSYRDYFGIFAILVGLLGCFFASRERKHLPLVRMSLYICLSLILGYVDSCIPLFLPGLRLGLANVVVLIALLDLGYGPEKAFAGFPLDLRVARPQPRPGRGGLLLFLDRLPALFLFAPSIAIGAIDRGLLRHTGRHGREANRQIKTLKDYAL